MSSAASVVSSCRRCLASTPVRRPSSRHLSTSGRSSIASLPSPPHSKRNTNVSQDPRYAEIQHIASHDPQNWLYPWAVFDAMGDSPPPESYSRLLHSLQRCSSQQSWRVLEEMRCRLLPLNVDDLALLMVRAIQNDNLELALRHLHLLRSRTSKLRCPPPLEPIEALIQLAAERNHPRLAVDIAEWFELSGDAKLSKSIWVSCLASSATNLYHDGLEVSWARVLSFSDRAITEGLRTVILQAASRLKLAELSQEALTSLT